MLLDRKFFMMSYNIDRPARAYVQIPLFVLFGENVIPYHISLYLFRLAGALAFFWILYMVWPGRRLAIFSMSLLFLIYPGFLAQTTPIDYQVAYFCAFFRDAFNCFKH